MYDQILNSKLKKHLLSGNFGLEKEHIRVTETAQISMKPHPEAFGNKLHNPYITTDFSECQIEMITPVCNSIDEAYNMLENIHDIVVTELQNELLWPGSMPPRIIDENTIQTAKYDNSEEGIKNESYREFLAEKYGKKKQLVSGIHYNFSFTDRLINEAYKLYGKDDCIQEFKNKIYLKMARNFMRYRWLLIYLLGASSTADESFVDNIYQHATSLRNSPIGYSNKEEIHLSLNSLDEYISDFKEYLNKSTLQYEKELYSPLRIRTKRGPFNLDNFKKAGVEYLEIRLLDINPLEKVGINKKDLYFIHLFMLYCLFSQEELFTKERLKLYSKNSQLTALFGRDESLKIYIDEEEMINIREWAKVILNQIYGLAQKIEADNLWLDAISYQMEKINDTSKLPSNIIAKECIDKGFLHFNLTKSVQFKKMTFEKSYRLKGFEDMELSTQILLRSAIKRGIKFEVLDKLDNFIALSKNGHIEYIKQATKTSLDSYSTFLIMENKLVSKIVLEKNKVKVPTGKSYTTMESALFDFDLYKDLEIVIKPKSTNFGIGISIIKGLKDMKTYEKAVKMAFQHDKSILIEEFIKGKEYRFLVVGDETVGILHRVPANVKGDGVRNIRQLVNEKNKDPLRGYGYKTPLEKIKLGDAEELFLNLQGLNFDYIPAKDEVVFLRENSNISTGGDSIDFTDEIIDDYKEIAVKASKSAGATICGVDIMIEDIKAKPNNSNHAVIEINFNPAIHIHDFPYKGKNRKVEEKILDLLFK